MLVPKKDPRLGHPVKLGRFGGDGYWLLRTSKGWRREWRSVVLYRQRYKAQHQERNVFRLRYSVLKERFSVTYESRRLLELHPGLAKKVLKQLQAHFEREKDVVLMCQRENARKRALKNAGVWWDVG